MDLDIEWKRLMINGETCERCSLTEEEVERAVNKLRETLEPIGINIELEKKKISKSEFEEDPISSNTILINDQPLEDWIGGEAGQSECCDVCGDEECRTVKVNDKEYEAVPSELIIKAGLEAVTQMKNERKCCSCSSDKKCCES